jgi:hypothetical protein
MTETHRTIKNIVSIAILVFPSILLLSFFMHIHTPGDFFTLRFQNPQYDSNAFFDTLVNTGGGDFIHAHAIAYLSVPFMIITILSLGYLLYPERPILSVIGVTVGVFGASFMAGFFASWLSFSAIARVEQQYQVGARAALEELTRPVGVLKIITQLSFLSLVGIIILCVGFIRTKLLPMWSPISILIGCMAIGFFMGLVKPITTK